MKLSVSLNFSPALKIKVGTLVDLGRETAFEYDRDFSGLGLIPSPFRLPVKSGAQIYDYAGGMETFGMFEDSLPDGWGRRLLDARFVKEIGRKPTVMERLSAVGMSGMGALVYEPETDSPVADDFDLSVMAESAMDFDAGMAEDVLPTVRKAGGSSGGARPKMFIGYNPETGEVCSEADELPKGFEHWLVKFNTRTDGYEAGEREFEYYKIAKAAGVEMMPSRLLETSAGKFFATKRFDRGDNGERIHYASAAGLLHADFRIPGEEYSILFKITDALTRDYSAKLELFRRVCLNVRHHNRDDHLKNFGFLMNCDGKWRLSPFYDFTWSNGPNGWHTLSIAGEGRNPTELDLMRLAESVGITASDSADVLKQILSHSTGN